MVDMLWALALLLLICDFVEPAIYHRRNREKLEVLCIKESPWKTYFDNVITNVLLTITIVGATFIIFTIIDIFI